MWTSTLHSRCYAWHRTLPRLQATHRGVIFACQAPPEQTLVRNGRVLKTNVAKLRVPQLQQLLAARGLETEGLKADLVARLHTALEQQLQQPQQRASSPAPSPSPPSPPQQQRSTPPVSATQQLPPQGPSRSSRLLTRHAPQRRTPRTPPTLPTPTTPTRASFTTPTPAPRTTPPLPSRRSHHTAIDPSTSTGMAITWLGTSSGAPSGKRNVSCIALRLPGATYLVDCGEGTFNQLQRAQVDLTTIRGIFITHMHGDHCFGIAGVLRAAATAATHPNNTRPRFSIYGPPGIQTKVLTALRLLTMDLPLDLEVWQYAAPNVPTGRNHNLTIGSCRLALRILPAQGATERASPVCAALANGGGGAGGAARPNGRPRSFLALDSLQWVIRLPDTGVTVTAAQLQHRVPCWGYVFAEGAQAGGRKVVLLGDTMDSTAIRDAAHGCDVLSHEATFARGMERKARTAQHSTAAMAGQFARQIRAKYDMIMVNNPKAAAVMDDEDDADALDEEFDSNNVQSLLQEAKQAFGQGEVLAAHDTYTYLVPQRV